MRGAGRAEPGRGSGTGCEGVWGERGAGISAVQKDGAAIRSLTLDHAPPDALGCPVAAATKANAMTLPAQVFIDCSYEGDLMARAGVSYTWGRESRDEYGESLAGVRPNLAVYAIDPYVTPDDTKSGLLPFIQDMKAQPEGSADRLTMGYGFRWKFSKDADRLPIPAPEHYDPKQWELYRRGFKNKAKIDDGRRMKGKLGFFEPAGGRIHSLGAGNLARALLATTNYGSNAEYPDGDYATRARIWKTDQEFMRGMTHFLRTDAFRYIAWEGGEELLYDLRTDPDELNNLANKPAQAKRMSRMRERLAAHLSVVTKSLQFQNR